MTRAQHFAIVTAPFALASALVGGACAGVASDAARADAGVPESGTADGARASGDGGASSMPDGSIAFDGATPDDGAHDAAADAADATPPDGDAADPQCALLADMTVTNPTWSAATIAPGDQPSVTITLTDNGADDNYYPGIRLSSDDAQVTISPPENSLFGILAGTSSPLAFTVSFDAAIPKGTIVHFHAFASTIHRAPCANAPAADFSITLQ
jgi:hypothetical protein